MQSFGHESAARLSAWSRVLAWMSLAALALLPACGTVAPFGDEMKTNALSSQGRRSVCVVSTLGNMFGITSLGLTAFTNEQWEVPVDGWQLDDYVHRRVHELIGARYDVQHVRAQASSFASLDQPGALFRNLANERADIVRTLVHGERCDYVLLIMRGTSSYGTTTQTLKGYGIVRSGDGLVIDNVYVFALARLTLFENHTFKVVTEQSIGPGKGLFTMMSGPHKKVDSASWPVPPSTADNPQMKAAVQGLFDSGLSSTVLDVVNVK